MSFSGYPGPAQQKTKQKADGDSDNINNEILANAIGDIVILPDVNGVLTSYVVVETVKLTKENNWKHVFKNLTFSSAYRDDDGYWILGDSGEYVIHEITPNNTELVSSYFVKYLTCPVDNGVKFVWNLTNRIIPNETTNKTPENNETVNETFNETDEEDLDEPLIAYGKGPEPSQNNSSSDSPKDSSSSENVDVSKSATGNPIFIILMALFVMIIPVLRKKE